MPAGKEARKPRKAHPSRGGLTHSEPGKIEEAEEEEDKISVDLSLLSQLDNSEHSEEEDNWDSLSFTAKYRMVNEWTFVLIVANCLHIAFVCGQVGPFDTDVAPQAKLSGLAVLLLWLSLNRYLSYSEDYSHLPNTFIGATRTVTSGMVGVLPAVIGFCFFATTQLYMDFRFRDVSSAMFTYFYNINGDTLFDTLYCSYKWAAYTTFIWTWLALMFGIFIILKLAIAMVEEGYIRNKQQSHFDWLFKTGAPRDLTRIRGIQRDQRRGVQAPAALRRYLIEDK